MLIFRNLLIEIFAVWKNISCYFHYPAHFHSKNNIFKLCYWLYSSQHFLNGKKDIFFSCKVFHIQLFIYSSRVYINTLLTYGFHKTHSWLFKKKNWKIPQSYWMRALRKSWFSCFSLQINSTQLYCNDVTSDVLF